MVLLLYAGLCALAALVVYGLHPVKRWRYRHIPGPPFRWLVGHLPEILIEGVDNAHARWAKEYGPGPFCFWTGGLPVVMTDNPELARKVLARPIRHKVSSLHIGVEAQFERYGIVFSNGDMWKAARNAWSPFFGKESLAKLAPLMTASAGRLGEHLGEAADSGREVNIWKELGRMTMDVVGTTAFGVNFDTLGRAPQEKHEEGGQQTPASAAKEGRIHTPADRLIWALKVGFETFGLGNPIFGLFFLFPELDRAIKWATNALPTPVFKQELASREEIRSVGVELVQQHLAHTNGNGKHTTEAATHDSASSSPQGLASVSRAARPGVVDPGSFLALIAPTMGKEVAGERLGELWAANQSSTFILAGYETTANAVCFSIYLLASHPEHEARLLAEVDSFDPSAHSEGLGPDALESRLPFTWAVIHEALRIYPPAPIAIREAKEGMELGGLAMPAKAALQVNINSMHRSERWWRDPLAFKPERFMPGTPEAAEVMPGAFLPFGDGTRKCIGWRFALMEATLSLAKLYRQFTFRLLPGQIPLKTRTVLTTGPADGVHVTVHRRS